MTTKKQRRKQIARTSALRREERLRHRAARRRRLQFVAMGLVVALAVGALVVWILTHDADSGTTGTARVDYDASSVDRAQTLSIEVTR